MWALIPLKRFANAKQRLSSVLSDEERSGLFLAMINDVLTVLHVHPDIDNILLVSDDPDVEQLAASYGVDWLTEQQLGVSGLNDAISAGVDYLCDKGVEEVFVIHGDLPLLSAIEVSHLISTHQYNGFIVSQTGQDANVSSVLTLAPDRHQQGTNGLICSTNSRLRFAYGENSFFKHRALAEQSNMGIQVVNLPGLAADIDKPEDLITLVQRASERIAVHSYQFIKAHGLAQRILEAATDSESLQISTEDLPSHEQALALADNDDTAALVAQAGELRDKHFHDVVTYSRKVFLPLTHLCRDVCHYCTFAQTPKKVVSPYMSVDEVLTSVRDASSMGCKEALFTLGERPEDRYSTARKALDEMGFASTLEYVAHVAGKVLEETGILPHINAGCMSREEIAMLRPVSASMGIMLESASTRLCEKGMPHYGSPDKDPKRRLETLRLAGEADVPFTTGILIGIGETRLERIESLLAIRDIHQEYGHIQEIIVQNFRAKPGTKMSEAPEPDLEDLLWTIAVARLIFGSQMSIQAPPNLSPGVLPKLVQAGINDWGGVSPVTPDFVNPEAPWPHVDKLAKESASAGKFLQQRLTIYPDYAMQASRWLDEKLQRRVLSMIDAEGYPRTDDWLTGQSADAPLDQVDQLKDAIDESSIAKDLRAIVAKAKEGETLSEQAIVRLFKARGPELSYVCQQADQLRKQVSGDTIHYVVNRNINYTNICYFKCQFCAFSKGKLSENLRGLPYDLDHPEIQRRTQEAWERGATEVCLQGGIHPQYTGQTYLDILAAIKQVSPDMHVHAFSPLEVWQGAKTLKLSLRDFLTELKAAGLKSLPGTAAEVLDDEVRQVICPDKINTAQWLEVIETAHEVGLKTTATIMFGHVDRPVHWARHLLRVRTLQRRTGGITEFVPLPFVAKESPMFLKGNARMGPTFRETLLMHAVSRLALHGAIDNIQTSWVKMGDKGIEACLNSGANDLGGTLMNETITRSAGAAHGQERSPQSMDALIQSIGRSAKQRTTLYGEVAAERTQSSYTAKELTEVINTRVSSGRSCAEKPPLIRAGVDGNDEGEDLIASA